MNLGLGLRLGARGVGNVPVDVLRNTYAGMTWIAGWDAAFGTLTQDVGGTTPVTAGGDLVGRVTDGVGSNDLVRLSNDSLRPTYQTGPKRLVYDGTDGTASAGSVTFGVSKITFVWVGDVGAHETGSNGALIATEIPTSANAGEWRFSRIAADPTGEIIVTVREPSSTNGDALTVENVPNRRAVHVVTLDSAPARPGVRWTVDGGSPLSIARTLESRTTGGNLASQVVSVGSWRDGTISHVCDWSLVAIASGEPTSGALADLVADLSGRV